MQQHMMTVEERMKKIEEEGAEAIKLAQEAALQSLAAREALVM